ncbi:MAG TPA: ribonuclease H-like domain-containing protein [Ignavibacteriales bacterium]|nr:ribonuclease H-like domain-containing protein [Ignavibacteriales bacterium]HOL81604.1 ribonuclease H-like domain-containing protein [Ignavibacteriales bacterium]HOM65566.1 ribonuclease H-like domain-containing protein [Ignavibacteriales bacterium]HPD67871.1 ribonuclease H-like domain-containing protein [Ignavibacteriales bacterium]HPP33718.1 ribonuclease H-like domain-containing protein [Ignavibacteriales bacterium]
MIFVYDIETLAFPFEALTPSQQEYLQRYAEKIDDPLEKQKKIEENIRYLSLYPYTAKIITLGMYEINYDKGVILYEDKESQEVWYDTDKRFKFIPSTEAEILEYFWSKIAKADKIVSFNGKNFDLPFLKIRSAINKIKVPKFDKKFSHIDLLDEFTFYGKLRKFNLDFYCHAFGIESPKTDYANGMEVSNLYQAGKFKEIAIYCSKDIYSTSKLYKIWENYLS